MTTTTATAECGMTYMIGADGREHVCDQPADHDGLHGTTDTHPAWCDRTDVFEGLHCHWIIRDEWRVQAIYDAVTSTAAVHVAITGNSGELRTDDARDLADAILAATAMLRPWRRGAY